MDRGGHEYKIDNFSPQNCKKIIFSKKVIGFFFDISDKFHPVARVYLPKVADVLPKWSLICPERALRLLWAHDLLKSSSFSKETLTEKTIVEALQLIDGNARDFQT